MIDFIKEVAVLFEGNGMCCSGQNIAYFFFGWGTDFWYIIVHPIRKVNNDSRKAFLYTSDLSDMMCIVCHYCVRQLNL